jgi:purine-nucleoside phosphorylase
VSEAAARVIEAAAFIRSRTHLTPRIAVVLGSGLGGFADELESAVSLPYSEIPHFPASTAIGHAGCLQVGTLSGTPLFVMQGRWHLYEGYSAEQVAFPIRVLGQMGVKAALLTNAAGAINPQYGCGDLVVIRDHINLQGQNPLAGAQSFKNAESFIDLTAAYSARLRQIALRQGERLGTRLHEGIYAAVLGPSFETPAEVRFLRTIGADLVGMSTVPEVIAARQIGMEVLAISCVTNLAAGLSDKEVTPEDVLQIGEQSRPALASLLRAVVSEIALSLSPE